MLLLVGLGNPGPRYAGHRHNVGFMAADEIVRRRVFSPWRARFNGEVAEGHLGGERTLILKPMTFMNELSKAVGEAVRFLKIPLDRVVVFHDELDLAPGRIRMKKGGGAGGHNGLRDIDAHVGNGLSPRAHRHRPSRPQGPGAALGAARLRARRARSQGRLAAQGL